MEGDTPSFLNLIDNGLASFASPGHGGYVLYYATHENHVPRIPHPRFRGKWGIVGVR